jgi:DHA1 family tetracycline resistance protein-like MFS transporter
MSFLFSKGNSRMIFILITMFLNFLGFSIIIPVLPFLTQKFVSNPNAVALNVGLIMSVYALCQFLAAPGLGALSDRYGRRPILLISLIGSIIGYLIMGVAGALWMLFLGRIIDGLTGGNISTIFAYIADITEPRERGKYYGMLGAAGGVGFMLGPAIGGITGNITLSFPLFLGAAVTLANVIWGYFALPESLSAENKTPTLNLTHLNPLAQFNMIFSVTILRRLFTIAFLFFLAITGMQGNTSVFAKDVLGWGVTQIGLFLFLVGVIDIFSQGFLIRKLLPIFGEERVALAGLVLSVLGFSIAALISIFPSTILICLGGVILITGDGLFEPSITGLISNSVGPKMQGRVQGANQGMQSVARIFGPLLAAWSYQYAKGLPYATEALLAFICFLLLASSLPLLRQMHLHPSETMSSM